ncbi:CHAT domain-containing protein [Propioniciclava sp. MC1595]|uniref:CHAT domain-containing protein n=1 Tax=Propioniciclava sp. MC1595 TaxID=2760308 RepID=UPI0016622A2C|nr:CHAT domain-containing protein [Propioniciclava sp. MC1595]MBB1496436.1 CHAT domain-containing protein [Propioniciclava sp. MC1595]QTE26018.1 CHAT domain-containing protein [Propioniciclava sp. MC1595]
MSEAEVGQTADTVVQAPRPIYIVACDISGTDEAPYEPVLTEPGPKTGVTSFDEELLAALPALWYAMHLPKTRFEVIDMPLRAIRANVSESRAHRILLMPAGLLHEPTALRLMGRHGEPTIVLCPGEHLEAAKAASQQLGCVLEPATFGSLSQESLDANWERLARSWARQFPPGVPILPKAPVWVPRISRQGSHLAWKNFNRLLGHQRELPPELEDPYDMALRTLDARVRVESLTQLEDAGTDPLDVASRMEDLFPEVAASIKMPLALSLMGVSPTYERSVRQGKRAEGGHDGTRGHDLVTDEDVADVLSLVVGHQAAGSDSMGVVLPDSIPPEAFHALADLERYWEAGRMAPAKERKLRNRLDDTMAWLWNDRLQWALRSASHVDAYTNFPIGLLRVPGHTAPLAAQVPIAYRPLNPLTRTLQQQLGPDDFTDLSAGFTVLVAECIKAEDPIGKDSRIAWSGLREAVGLSSAPTKVVIEETLSAKAVREEIERHHPDVLIVSAHGVYAREQNVAGLRIGDDFSLGLDLGPMPPLVVLSACASGPRGGGAVAVTDLLIRQGADAVISTLVPVRVHHNAVFMSRLFLYIGEAINGRENHTTLMDLWHRVQANTVILDILYGNARLGEWGHRATNGLTPVAEFMGRRAAGRIRSSHLYEDTEAVLLEIADDQGMRDKVENWLRTPGYVPESMMYTVVGDPTRIRFRPSQLRQRSRS